MISFHFFNVEGSYLYTKRLSGKLDFLQSYLTFAVIEKTTLLLALPGLLFRRTIYAYPSFTGFFFYVFFMFSLFDPPLIRTANSLAYIPTFSMTF